MKIERAIQESLRMLKFEDVRSRYQDGKLGCEGAAELQGNRCADVFAVAEAA